MGVSLCEGAHNGAPPPLPVVNRKMGTQVKSSGREKNLNIPGKKCHISRGGVEKSTVASDEEFQEESAGIKVVLAAITAAPRLTFAVQFFYPALIPVDQSKPHEGDDGA